MTTLCQGLLKQLVIHVEIFLQGQIARGKRFGKYFYFFNPIELKIWQQVRVQLQVFLYFPFYFSFKKHCKHLQFKQLIIINKSLTFH